VACAMLKTLSAMRRFSRKWLVLAPVVIALPPILAIEFAPHVASAQVSTTPTTTATVTATPCASTLGGTPTVSVTNQIPPSRFSSTGAALGISTRNAALTPNGVSYADCINDLTLQFGVTACNFVGGVNLQVWASTSSDCTSPADRGLTGVAVCWLISQGSTDLIQASGSLNYNIRVQDIVGPQQRSPSPTTLTSNGPEACTAQPTFLAVPIYINFVPIGAGGVYAGQAYQYQLQTDMVGPQAPAIGKIGNGDTLFIVNWTPNVDTDTAGYDVVIDPVPGHEPLEPDAATADATISGTTDDAATDGESSGGVATVQRICPDGATSMAAITDATMDDGSADGSMDGSTAITDGAVGPILDDAGCYTLTTGSNPPLANSTVSDNGGTCNDPTLSTGVILAGSGSDAAAAVVTQEFDDAGDLLDSGVQQVSGGGIFTPPPGSILNPNATVGTTVTGVTSSTYTVKNLKDGVPYTVVVAAVDNFGNIGPPSTQACATPAPIDDFFKDYVEAGGKAGGGFCALEAVGAPVRSGVAFAGVGAFVAAGLRRRRGKKR
jgi:hypothetical protein